MMTSTLPSAEAFAALIPQMSERDQSFATDLLRSYRGRGLSDKQAYWVQTLADRVTAPKGPAASGLNLEPLAVMMRRAKDAGLVHPKVRLAYEGMTFSLSLAGAASANAGHLYVKIDGDYVGKISPAGDYRGKPLAVAALQSFSADPVAAAKSYGKLTGCCSFCSRPLSDERSTANGYGKTCAAKYGMPWG
jgi:hypothetical protein